MTSIRLEIEEKWEKIGREIKKQLDGIRTQNDWKIIPESEEEKIIEVITASIHNDIGKQERPDNIAKVVRNIMRQDKIQYWGERVLLALEELKAGIEHVDVTSDNKAKQYDWAAAQLGDLLFRKQITDALDRRIAAKQVNL